MEGGLQTLPGARSPETERAKSFPGGARPGGRVGGGGAGGRAGYGGQAQVPGAGSLPPDFPNQLLSLPAHTSCSAFLKLLTSFTAASVFDNAKSMFICGQIEKHSRRRLSIHCR